MRRVLRGWVGVVCRVDVVGVAGVEGIVGVACWVGVVCRVDVVGVVGVVGMVCVTGVVGVEDETSGGISASTIDPTGRISRRLLVTHTASACSRASGVYLPSSHGIPSFRNAASKRFRVIPGKIWVSGEGVNTVPF